MTQLDPRRAILLGFTWPNAAQPPRILDARDAYFVNMTTFDARYYRVDFCGDMPAGFTRFDFLGKTPTTFRIKVHTEPCDFETMMADDEIVLVFEDVKGETHA